MTCQEATLQLPWWLNGSLEPAERREVEDHLASCASCREALAETRLAWEIYAQHIPTAALVAYAEDERPEGPTRPTGSTRPSSNAISPTARSAPPSSKWSGRAASSSTMLKVPLLGDRFGGRQAAPAREGP